MFLFTLAFGVNSRACTLTHMFLIYPAFGATGMPATLLALSIEAKFSLWLIICNMTVALECS